MEIVEFILGKIYKRYVMLITICFGFTPIHAQWEFVGSPESCEPVFFDSEGDTLLVLTTGGLFYSSDIGLSWLPIELPDSVYVFEEIQIERSKPVRAAVPKFGSERDEISKPFSG